MKKCKTCEVDLVIGENITQGMYNNKNYDCKKCWNAYRREANRKKRMERSESLITGVYEERKCKGCEVDLVVGENTTQAKYNNGDWRCKDCARSFRREGGKQSAYYRRKWKERNDASVAGVYGIYYGDNLLYVGESQFCQARFHNHLNHTPPNSKSAIGLDVKKYRHDYRQVIFLEEEDKRLRHLAEIELIVKHKPPLNSPYRVRGYIHSPVDEG